MLKGVVSWPASRSFWASRRQRFINAALQGVQDVHGSQFWLDPVVEQLQKPLCRSSTTITYKNLRQGGQIYGPHKNTQATWGCWFLGLIYWFSCKYSVTAPWTPCALLIPCAFAATLSPLMRPRHPRLVNWWRISFARTLLQRSLCPTRGSNFSTADLSLMILGWENSLAPIV